MTGSHAALTCHICLMRHTETGVVSIGHFDNFCCWQFGEESSAHKDGIQIMLEEIGKAPFLKISGLDRIEKPIYECESFKLIQNRMIPKSLTNL